MKPFLVSVVSWLCTSSSPGQLTLEATDPAPSPANVKKEEILGFSEWDRTPNIRII